MAKHQTGGTLYSQKSLSPWSSRQELDNFLMYNHILGTNMKGTEQPQLKRIHVLSLASVPSV